MTTIENTSPQCTETNEPAQVLEELTKILKELSASEDKLCDFLYDRRAYLDRYFKRRESSGDIPHLETYVKNRLCLDPYTANLDLCAVISDIPNEGDDNAIPKKIPFENIPFESFKADGRPYTWQLKTSSDSEISLHNEILTIDLKFDNRLTNDIDHSIGDSVIIYVLKLDLNEPTHGRNVDFREGVVLIGPKQPVVLVENEENPKEEKRSASLAGYLNVYKNRDPQTSTAELYLKLRDVSKRPVKTPAAS